MSSKLAAKEALALIDSIKATVEEIGSRAVKLNENLQTTLVRETRRYETTLEEQSKQFSADNLKAQESFQQTKAAAQADFERRKTRIGRAYQSSREQAIKRVDERLGALKYELQKSMLQAEKDRDAGLAAATQAARDFEATLAAEQDNLSALERRAQLAFKGYGGFRRRFLAAYQQPAGATPGDEQQLLAHLRQQTAKAKTDLDKFRGFLVLGLFR